ncbi:family 78 glycoside hydrolase catalytic domain [Bifidobacterium sp. ESL0745]|uniref:family 78 glycoside hydrolase catalytic domain n=1 Tax=Bifidobacterium sp. ESL0745 TaxID=2983226 RepID=UPI0023F67F03|nr:family 78 glycoside hydrolase catalytic domain [Bifidobacterium sp. ESL0745]MDF7666102.1 family 78 glycoside hydrolase catalytic domain [Bifidobacterium sp. ESL0745]
MKLEEMQSTSGTPVFKKVSDDDEGEASYRPHELLTALRDKPIGIGQTHPRLWWEVPVVPGVGGDQLSYQIELSNDVNGFADGALVQSTPEITSSQSTAVPWPFERLVPRQVAFWRVRVRVGTLGGKSVLTGWSEPVKIVVGPLSPRDWDNAIGIWTVGGAPVRPADPGPATSVDGTFSLCFKVLGESAGIFFRITADCQDGYLWRFNATDNTLDKVHVRNGHENPITSVKLPQNIDLRQYVNLSINIDGNRTATFIDDIPVDVDDNITNDGSSFGFKMAEHESIAVKSASIVPLNQTEPIFQATYDKDSVVPTYAHVTDDAMVIDENSFGLLGDVLPGDYWALLRREFDLPEGTVVGAYLYATGRSPIGARQHVYRAWVNGQYAGEGPARDIGRRTYETHDVTDMVRPGATNVLALQAWAQTGGRVQALLDVHYADGSIYTVVSGPEWQGRPGLDWRPWVGDMNVKVNYFVAPREDIDARHEPVGWQSSNYQGSDFRPVATYSRVGNLHADSSNGIGVIAYQPVSVTQLAPGSWLFDAGVERVYSVRCKLDVPQGLSGTQLRLRMGEELNDDGSVRYNLRSGIRYEDTWTLRKGKQSIEHWGYRCFRYLQIDTVESLDLSDAITLLNTVVPEPEQIGSFHSSDDVLNEVWQLCANSMRENRNDLYMDTPTRERMPYEGDLVTRGRGEVVYSHSYDLLRKSCRYIVRAPGKFTEYKFMPIQMAYEEYLETGDTDALSKDWGLYEREQGLRWLNKDGLIEKDRKTPMNDDIIDWPQPKEIDGFEFTRVNAVVNAWQYAAFVYLADAAQAVGREDDASRLRRLAKRMRSAMNTEMFDSAIGAYHDGRDSSHTAMHSTMYATALGVAENKDLKRIGQWLTADGKLDWVPVSCNAVAWLLEALYRTGQDQAALEVMRSHSETSWWSMMHRWGATQTMEAWSPDIKPNTTFAHPWGASPIVAISRWMLGVKLVKAGASQIAVEPHPADLPEVQGSVVTVRGLVSVQVKQQKSTTLTVTVPGNTRGTLRWPLSGHTLQDVAVTYPDGHDGDSSASVDSDTIVVPLSAGTTTVVVG